MVARALRSPFWYLGAGIASHWLVSAAVIALGVVALGVINIGWAFVENETDVEELWVDRGSHVYDDIQYVKKHVPKGGGMSQELLIVAGADGSGANVLTKPALSALLAASKKVRDIAVDVDGKRYVLDDVCFSAEPYSWPCLALTPLDCFSEGRYNFDSYENGSSTIKTWLAARTDSGPYASRPSFEAMDDASIATRVGGNCRFWDDAEFLGSIPKTVIVGGAEPKDAQAGSCTCAAGQSLGTRTPFCGVQRSTLCHCLSNPPTSISEPQCINAINALCTTDALKQKWPTNWCNFFGLQSSAMAASFVGMSIMNGACWQDAAESAKQVPVRGSSGSCFSDVDCGGAAKGACSGAKPMTSAKALEAVWTFVEAKALVRRFSDAALLAKRQELLRHSSSAATRATAEAATPAAYLGMDEGTATKVRALVVARVAPGACPVSRAR